MKQYKRKEIPYECIIDIEYMPFPSEEKRKEAYYTHAELFLRAKERALKKTQGKSGSNNIEERLAAPSSLFLTWA